MTRAEIKLSPQQAAVMQALQRLEAATSLEGVQLGSTWGQKGMGDELLRISAAVHQLGEKYLADCNRSIVIASEVPAGVLASP